MHDRQQPRKLCYTHDCHFLVLFEWWVVWKFGMDDLFRGVIFTVLFCLLKISVIFKINIKLEFNNNYNRIPNSDELFSPYNWSMGLFIVNIAQLFITQPNSITAVTSLTKRYNKKGLGPFSFWPIFRFSEFFFLMVFSSFWVPKGEFPISIVDGRDITPWKRVNLVFPFNYLLDFGLYVNFYLRVLCCFFGGLSAQM